MKLGTGEYVLEDGRGRVKLSGRRRKTVKPPNGSSAARQVSENRCQDPLRSRNLEIGKAGLRPAWAGDVIPGRPKRPHLSLKRSATATGFEDYRLKGRDWPSFCFRYQTQFG